MELFPILQRVRVKHEQYSKEKSERRLDKQTDRKDFIRLAPSFTLLPKPKLTIDSYILRHNDKKGMTREEIIETSALLIVAGSETSATCLSGAIFYLLKNPPTLSRLVTEIRTSFPDGKEMSIQKLAKLPYLNAVLQEALRMYPPVPGILSRRMIPGGGVINGYYIPANVSTPPPFLIPQPSSSCWAEHPLDSSWRPPIRRLPLRIQLHRSRLLRPGTLA